MNDKIKEAMFQLELAALKSFREIFFHSFFNNPGPRETDKGADTSLISDWIFK